MFTDLLSAATADYGAVEGGGVRPAEALIASARRFAQRIAAFEAAGTAGLDTLDAALRDPDWFKRNTSARILSVLSDPRAAAILIAAFVRSEPHIDARHLGRLGKVHPLPPGSFPPLDDVPQTARGDLAIAIMRHPAPRARAMVEGILAGREALPLWLVLKPLAAWGERATLRTLLDRPPEKLPKGRSRVLALDDDVPAQAAFYLVLAGEPDALDRLEDLTRDARHPYAGPAIERLGLLAHPRAVAPTARLLRARRLDTIASALDAASALATPLLGESLAALAESRRGPSSLTAAPLWADAVAALAELVGIEPPEADPGGRRALISLRTALLDLDPRLRYRAGNPLTLADLARDLASSHAGPRSRAAWGLRAITGEDHGYDVDDDLASNLAAIDAWHARARDPSPIGAGGWAFLGSRVEPPAAVK